MFRSGVFWMGLVFIPVTSLVFDVAYKVWVSPLSSGQQREKSTGRLISPRRNSWVHVWPLKMFSFLSRKHTSRNIHNIAARRQVDPSLQQFLHVRINLKSSVLFSDLSERHLCQQMKYLNCQTLKVPSCWSLCRLAGWRGCVSRPWWMKCRSWKLYPKTQGQWCKERGTVRSHFTSRNFRFRFYTLKWATVVEAC